MERYVINKYHYNEMTTFDCAAGTITFEGLSDGVPISYHSTKEESFLEMAHVAFGCFVTLCSNDYTYPPDNRYKMEVNHDEGYCIISEKIGNDYITIRKWVCVKLDE